MDQLAVMQCRHCNSSVRYKAPASQGTFRLTCPKCGGVNIIRFIPKEIRMQSVDTVPSSVAGTAGEGTVSNKEIVSCPDCGQKMRFTFEADGDYSMPCPKCNATVVAKVKEGKVSCVSKRQTKPIDLDANTQKGKLTVVRYWGILGSLGNKSFPLHIGQNTIGRYDEDLHSDIEIKGDATMSRRSVVIEVIQKESGYLFKLKVLKAANPVMHNNKPIVEGEVVYLNYGDSIKLGKTAFVFDKM